MISSGASTISIHKGTMVYPEACIALGMGNSDASATSSVGIVEGEIDLLLNGRLILPVDEMVLNRITHDSSILSLVLDFRLMRPSLSVLGWLLLGFSENVISFSSFSRFRS